MTARALADFEIITFDCYGTLIDWETGILAGLRSILDGHGAVADDEALLEQYARFEAAAEAGAYLPYREVLARSLRGVCAGLGCEPSLAETQRFSESVGDWPRSRTRPRRSPGWPDASAWA